MAHRTFNAEEARFPEPPIDEPGMNPDPLTGTPGHTRWGRAWASRRR